MRIILLIMGCLLQKVFIAFIEISFVNNLQIYVKFAEYPCSCLYFLNSYQANQRQTATRGQI